jgi:hypothetical protein
MNNGEQMDEGLLAVVAPVFGFVLGIIVLARVGRWGESLVIGSRRWRGVAGERVSLGSLLILVFLHSGPWLLAAFSYWAFVILSKAHSANWNWFFGAAVASWPVMLAFAWLVVYRAKQRRSAGSLL